MPNGQTLTYVIDAQNHRVAKKRNGVLEQGFVYDGDRVVAELDAAGNVVARFVYATQSHSPDVILKGGASYRIVKDQLGSPRLVVNQVTGIVVHRMRYDAWGEVTFDRVYHETTGALLAEPAPRIHPFGFAGGLYDRDTGLVRFGARDYLSRVGRWTAKDSIRFDGGDTNLFAYCGNEPVNRIDPSGRSYTGGGGASGGGGSTDDSAPPTGAPPPPGSREPCDSSSDESEPENNSSTGCGWSIFGSCDFKGTACSRKRGTCIGATPDACRCSK